MQEKYFIQSISSLSFEINSNSILIFDFDFDFDFRMPRCQVFVFLSILVRILIFDFCGRFTFMGISAVSGDIALISGRLFFAARIESSQFSEIDSGLILSVFKFEFEYLVKTHINLIIKLHCDSIWFISLNACMTERKC